MFIGWNSVYLLIPGVLNFLGPGSECIIYYVKLFLFYHPGRAGGGDLQALSGEEREGFCRGCEASRQGLHPPATLQGGVALRQSCPSSWIRESRPGALQNKDFISWAVYV